MSRNRLLTTIAYQLDGRPTYALEGSIFAVLLCNGARWSRSYLACFRQYSSGGAGGCSAPSHLVPAFIGLGAPYWDAEARGALYGLTRDPGLPTSLKGAGKCRLSDTGSAGGDARIGAPTGGIPCSGSMAAWSLRTDHAVSRRHSRRTGDRPVVAETTALSRFGLVGVKHGYFPAPAGMGITGPQRRARPHHE